jgi:fructose-1,6-bisphosphatase/inositol monophosphatase family enzyme
VKLSPDDLQTLANVAIGAASDAAEMVSRSRPQNVEHKADGESLASQVVTEIDRRSEDIVLEALTPTRTTFDLGLLTEEQADDGSRHSADHFWCIDPLDGTLPFIEGVPGYAVSVALVSRDGTPRIGVVVDPVTGTQWHAVSGAGAFRDGQRWSVEPHAGGGELSVFADRSFLERDDHGAAVAALEHIAHDTGLTGIRIDATGGAVMNACGVLAQPSACYVKQPGGAGGGSLWDFAATACLFHEAGAVATDIHGAPLDLNRSDSTFMNHRGVLFATDPDLAEQIRQVEPFCS